MGQKVTTDPFDYRYYVDDAVLVKIKELVNSNSISPVYANLVNSIKVGADQNSQKSIEETKADIQKEDTKTSNTAIDLKRALDVLRFKNDESNPYFPKGENATTEAIADFKTQYQNALDIMTAHVGTDPNKVTELPSRVVVAQKDYLLQSIKQSRQEAVNEETTKLSNIQVEANALRSQYESAKENLKALQEKDPNTMTIDQQQAHNEAIAQAQKNVTNIRAIIYNNLSEAKTTRENIKDSEKVLSKTDKDFGKSLKKAEKKIEKEERLTFKQMVKNIKTSISNKIEEYKTQKAFEEILGKEETQAPSTPQPEKINNEVIKENTEAKEQSADGKPVVLTAEETAAREAAKQTELENRTNELSAKLQSGEITQEEHFAMSIELAKEFGQDIAQSSVAVQNVSTEQNTIVEQNINEASNNDFLVNSFVNEMRMPQESAEIAANILRGESIKANVEAPQEAAPATQEGMTE